MQYLSILLGLALLLLTACTGEGHGSRSYILSESTDQIELVEEPIR